MKKTGSFFPAGILFYIFLTGVFGVATAQNVTVEATVSETKVFTGERISLSVEISGDFNNISRPHLPNLLGLRLLSNTPSTSRSYSYINGESSTTYSYRYSLIAQKEGSYEIPSISITIDGTEYHTTPVSISIVDRNTSSINSSSSANPDIFLRLEVSDNTPVTGQQLVTDIVLYFKSGLEVNSYQPVPGWKAEGFWKEELENADRPRAESVIINGIRYRKARLLQFSLFPTKSGELTISPFEILVAVRSTSSGNDPFGSFFGGSGSNQRRVELETDPVTLQVDEIPPITDAVYPGAVGSLNISRNISAGEAVAGETIEIETRISGNGNIPLISKPEYELPEGLEVYEPQESSTINRRGRQISGSKTFTDIVIARKPGTFTLPAVKVAYFNPEQERYVTKTLQALNFTVHADPDAYTVSVQQQSFNLSPVTGLALWVTTEQPPSLSAYWWFWAGLVLPAVTIAVAYRQKIFREKMNSDKNFARSRKAYPRAEELLREAIAASEKGDIKTAYNRLHKGLTGYIGDRIGLPEAGLSDKEYLSHLEQQGMEPELIKNVRLLLDKCSTISYAPETSHEYLKSHVGLAEKILKQLKKDL